MFAFFYTFIPSLDSSISFFSNNINVSSLYLIEVKVYLISFFFFLLNGKISVRISVALTVSLVREKNQIKNKTERQQLETQTGKNKHLE